MKRLVLLGLLGGAGCGAPTFDVGTPFTIAHVAPSGGATGIAVDTDVRVGFNDAIDRTSAAENVRLSIGGDGVEHSMLFFDEDSVLVLVPTRTLPLNTLVRLDIGADIESTAGVDLDSPFVAEFTTEE